MYDSLKHLINITNFLTLLPSFVFEYLGVVSISNTAALILLDVTIIIKRSDHLRDPCHQGMPKKVTKRRASRPSGPYDLRPGTVHPATTMDVYHSASQPTTTSWTAPGYSTYAPEMMAHMAPYATSPALYHQVHHPSMATPVLPPVHHPRGHTRMSSHFSQAAATQAWTTEEDELLVMAKKKGMQWSAISEAYFPEKSGNSVENATKGFRPNNEPTFQKHGWSIFHSSTKNCVRRSGSHLRNSSVTSGKGLSQ